MRQALTVGAPLLTRFASALSLFDKLSRPPCHIVPASSCSRGKKLIFADDTILGWPNPPKSRSNVHPIS
jgi:hypothetical protein